VVDSSSNSNSPVSGDNDYKDPFDEDERGSSKTFKRPLEKTHEAFESLPESQFGRILDFSSASLRSRVSKRLPDSKESKLLSNVFNRRVLQKIPETHCSAGIHSDVNGEIDPDHRFVLTKNLEKFIYDIRELVEYILSKESDPNWMGTDWQRPPVEMTGKDLSVLMEEYNERVDDDMDKINLVPFMDRLNRMKPKKAEEHALGKALVDLKNLMSTSDDFTIEEEAFRIQETFERINSLGERMQSLILHLKDPKTGNTLSTIKKKVDLAKYSVAGGSDICIKDLLDPMKGILFTYTEKYHPAGLSLGILEEEDEF
jgi:hypothetical protein